MKRFSITFLVFYLLCDVVYAQYATTNNSTSTVINNTKNPSYTAGALGGLYAPDLFTGSVNVSIPIYDFNIDGLDLGVSLGYNTLGVKVDQAASNVGLGWSLNTGGIVVRQVNGIEDELTMPEIDTPNSSGAMVKAISPEIGFLVDAVGLTFSGTESLIEKEPDVFTASVAGRSFDFSSANGNVVDCDHHLHTFATNPHSNMLIDWLINDATLYEMTSDVQNFNHVPYKGAAIDGYYLNFHIIDENGNQFFFTPGEVQTKEYEYPYYVDGTIQYYFPVQTWLLSKVITCSGNIIKYTYGYGSMFYPAYNDQRVKADYHYIEPAGAVASDGTTSVAGTERWGSINVLKNDTVEYSARYPLLLKIEYPNGASVNFNYSANTRCDVNDLALASIVVNNKYSTDVSNSLTYRLNHSYYVAGSAIDSSYADSYDACSGMISAGINITYGSRLKLTGIDKVGSDGTSLENYFKFNYNTTPLPSRLSPSRDCYGYYNGAAYPAIKVKYVSGSHNDSTLMKSQLANIAVPLHTDTIKAQTYTNTYTYGTNLMPNVTYAQAGLLTKITNGLGGSLTFSYKDHSLSNPPDFNTSGTVNTGYFDHEDVYKYNGWGTYVPPPTTYLDAVPYLYGSTANDGVCIDKIVANDGFTTDNNITTTFTLTNGTRFFPGGYFWYPTTTEWRQIYSGSTDYSDIVHNNSQNAVYERMYQNSFVNPADYINGANHGYSNATVKVTGYGSEILSTKSYKFSNLVSKDNEIDGIAANQSWLRTHYGLVNYVLPREFFEKEALGLTIEEDDLDKVGSLLSQTINLYTLKRFKDTARAVRFYSYNGRSTYNTIGGAATEDPTMGFYTPLSNSLIQLKQSTKRNYFSATAYSEDTHNYLYFDDDFNNNLKYDIWKDSKNNAYLNEYPYTTLTYNVHYGDFYFCDISTPSEDPDGLEIVHTLSVPIGVRNWKLNPSYVIPNPPNDAVDKVIGLSSTGKVMVSQAITPVYLQITTSMAAVISPLTTQFGNTGPVAPTDVSSITDKHYTVRSDHSNVVETAYNNDQTYSSAIWDTRVGQKVATVTNAHYQDIAYTSFEGTFAPFGTLDYNKGNWDFNTANIVLSTGTDKAITGHYYYRLTGSDHIQSLNALTAGKTYFLTFWCDAPPIVKIGTTTISMGDYNHIGSLHLYGGYFTAPGGVYLTLNASGTNKIDELRLCPADASMTTITYEPLFGPSATCDERNNIMYYEYDVMGRQKTARDINGNVIELTKTKVLGTND